MQAPPGDSGDMHGPHGIVLRLEYSEPTQTLRICIATKPWWVPEHRIWEIVEEAVRPYAGP